MPFRLTWLLALPQVRLSSCFTSMCVEEVPKTTHGLPAWATGAAMEMSLHWEVAQQTMMFFAGFGSGWHLSPQTQPHLPGASSSGYLEDFAQCFFCSYCVSSERLPLASAIHVSPQRLALLLALVGKHFFWKTNIWWGHACWEHPAITLWTNAKGKR